MAGSIRVGAAKLLAGLLIATAMLRAQAVVEIQSVLTISDGATVTVVIEANGPLPLPTPGFVESPPRLFFDFNGAIPKRKAVTSAPGYGVVQQTRTALYATNVTRVVLDLVKMQVYRIDADERAVGRIKIVLSPQTLTGEAAPSSPPIPPSEAFRAPDVRQPTPAPPPPSAAGPSFTPPAPTGDRALIRIIPGPQTAAPPPPPAPAPPSAKPVQLPASPSEPPSASAPVMTIPPAAPRAPVPAAASPSPALPSPPASAPANPPATTTTPPSPADPAAGRQRPTYTPPPSAPKPPAREVERYRERLSGALERLQAQQPIVTLLDAEGSISLEALEAALVEFRSVKRVLDAIKPSEMMASTHDLLVASCTLAATATSLGIEASRDHKEDVRKNAASAAAGALMFFDRVCADLGCGQKQ